MINRIEQSDPPVVETASAWQSRNSLAEKQLAQAARLNLFLQSSTPQELFETLSRQQLLPEELQRVTDPEWCFTKEEWLIFLLRIFTQLIQGNGSYKGMSKFDLLHKVLTFAQRQTNSEVELDIENELISIGNLLWLSPNNLMLGNYETQLLVPVTPTQFLLICYLLLSLVSRRSGVLPVERWREIDECFYPVRIRVEILGLRKKLDEIGFDKPEQVIIAIRKKGYILASEKTREFKELWKKGEYQLQWNPLTNVLQLIKNDQLVNEVYFSDLQGRLFNLLSDYEGEIFSNQAIDDYFPDSAIGQGGASSEASRTVLISAVNKSLDQINNLFDQNLIRIESRRGMGHFLEIGWRDKKPRRTKS